MVGFNLSLSLFLHTWQEGYYPAAAAAAAAAVAAVLVVEAEAPPPGRAASCPQSPPHRHYSQSHREGPTYEPE